MLVCAAPAVGSTWRVSLTNSAELVAKASRAATLNNYMPGSAVVDLKVLEVADERPRKVAVTVVRTELHAFPDGPSDLALNYGEPEFSVKVNAADQQAVNLSKLIKELIRPDPVVAAAATLADPCSAQASATIGTAAGQLVNHLYGFGQLRLADGASATCVKGKPEWTVKFVLIREGSVDLVNPFTGTVSVPKGAWHSNVDLRSAFKWSTDDRSGKVELSGVIHLSTSFVAR
jgi:hypothetical protein